MSEPKKFVVGIDGSENATDALVLANRLTSEADELIAVFVHPYGKLAGFLGEGEREQAVRDVANKSYEAIRENLDPNVGREMRLVSSPTAAEGLMSVAEREQADAIVVGPSHNAEPGRLLAGGTAETLLSGASTPVAVAPRGLESNGEGTVRIGCGFDGSAESVAALGWAFDLSRSLEATLIATAVFEPVAFGGVSVSGAFGTRSANSALREVLTERLEAAVSELGDEVEVETRTVNGDPAAELTSWAEDLDLLVLGSRGYGPIRSVLLGSVSRTLVRGLPCSVVVLPRGAEE